ncbi:MAG: hypothetical protein KatS3mg120_0797 [Erythrobacter sp.]|nr:MAG: hypothetical protein KatS3mg120_0797 [Erythrobacter sp.]
MGGHVPLGYDVKDRKLVVNAAEAEQVRMIFERFVRLGSATTLAKALAAEGVVTKRGKPIDKGFLYKLINNRVYLGEAVHKGTSYPGEHEAIIDQALWDKVHSILRTSPRLRAKNTRRQTPALLKGIIFTDTGTAMTPTATKKGTRLYRYYASMDLIRNRPMGETCGPLRLPAGMVEDAVVGEIRRMIRAPEIAGRTIKTFREESPTVDEKAVVQALGEFDQLWAALYPAEQTRIVQLLVERVTVGREGIAIDLRSDGLGAVVREMLAAERELAA